eukprot:COSAG02_NODE_536_length_20657_cov_91.744041_18_plen_63_part_00
MCQRSPLDPRTQRSTPPETWLTLENLQQPSKSAKYRPLFEAEAELVRKYVCKFCRGESRFLH